MKTPAFSRMLRLRWGDGTTRKWLRRAGIAIGSALLLFVVTFAVGVPYAVRWALETMGTRELGRTVRVESIRANPFLLRVTLEGLSVADADAAAKPFIAIDRLVLNASTLSIFHRAPVLDAVEIDGAAVRIARLQAQRFSFSDIIERLQARPRTADSGPARFAVYNIQVRGSRLDFDDRLQHQQHAVTDIALGVPFISSLPADITVKVLPLLSARVDGTPLEMRGETQPFEETHESLLRLKLDGLDLPEYLGFVPVPLNFALPQARLDTDLTVVFRGPVAAREGRTARGPELVISGLVGLRDVALQAPREQGAPLLQFKSLRVRLGELAPLAQRVRIDDVNLSAPEVWVARHADGQLNWLRFAQTAVGRPAGGAPEAGQETASKPWQAQLRALKISDGLVHVSDDTVGHFEQDLAHVAVGAQDLSTAEGAPAGRVDLRLDVVPQGSIAIAGTLSPVPLSGELDFRADDVQLRAAARHLAQVVNATLTGSTDVSGKLRIGREGSAVGVSLVDLAGQGRAIGLRGPEGSGAALDIARLQIEGGALDLVKREAHFASLSIVSPKVVVKRLNDGELGWLRVVKGEPAGPQPAETATAHPWDVQLERFEIAGGSVTWEDEAVDPVGKLAVTSLQLGVRNFTLAGRQPIQVSARGRLAGPTGGRFALDGAARLQPAQADLRLNLRNIDLAPARPYLAQYLNAVLVSAELSSRSKLHYVAAQGASPQRVRLDADLRLANLHVLDPGGEDDLLKWQALDVDRIGLSLGEDAPEVDVGGIALADFFARIIVSPEGRLNLADLIRRPAEEPPKASPGEPAPAPAERPRVRIERIAIARGQVNFTDNFIRPNYTANLTDIGGSVSTLASDATEPATLQLEGSVDREAPVTISGRVNPLAPKTFLDISGSTKGVDLPRFTPYAAKYAGYPITKGKLSLDVSYRIENDTLKANNRLFLDQLTFGEHVDSPSATKLPVLLAVSLLKNSRGEIDINLPISGSLNDPKFSVGGIIVKVIVNLLAKVVTAPFALLGAAFGAGEELSYVDFAPGLARIDAAQTGRLDTLGKALNDRPGLRLDIIGRASSAADDAGLRRAQLDGRLRAAKVRQQIRAGGASMAPDSVTVEQAERDALLGVVYDEDRVVKKPRNALGFARSLPAPEMERLLLDSMTVSASDLRGLANARAAVVRDYLEQKGKVPRERMFLVEPKVDAADPPDAKGSPTRVDFSLK